MPGQAQRREAAHGALGIKSEATLFCGMDRAYSATIIRTCCEGAVPTENPRIIYFGDCAFCDVRCFACGGFAVRCALCGRGFHDIRLLIALPPHRVQSY